MRCEKARGALYGSARQADYTIPLSKFECSVLLHDVSPVKQIFLVCSRHLNTRDRHFAN